MYSLIALPLMALTAHAASSSYCPLLGPAWPAPSLNTDSEFASATRSISQKLDALGKSGNLTDSISIQIFSGSEAKSLFTYSYTAPPVKNATIGVKEVTEDSIFRIGSGSKLWTMLLLLMKTHSNIFNDPVAKYVPQLQSASKDLQHNSTMQLDQANYIQWDQVTIGELASHLAGIPRDYGFADLTSLPGQLQKLEAEGFPKLKGPVSCGGLESCTKEQFFDGLLKMHPSGPTSSTPMYTNSGYVILGFVIEAISGKSYEENLKEDLLVPLGLGHSSYDHPASDKMVIPNESWTTTYWNISAGTETPAGGLYSSAKDMATVGRAILNNTLIPAAVTRKWMKPVTHTGSPNSYVGHVWEIASLSDPRVIDLYTKSGDIGTYSSQMVLSPDHNAGFTVLAAGDDTTATVALITDQIIDALIPALESTAKAQAKERLAGTYKLPQNNSTLTLTTDDGPGLKVSNWSYQSLDMISFFAEAQSVDVSEISIRLYPTGAGNPSQLGYRAIIQVLEPKTSGLISGACVTWFNIGSFTYGGISLDDFLFTLDRSGRAVSLSPRGLRQTLRKK